MLILITGGKGQLGLELEKQLSVCGSTDSIVTTDRHNLDITDPKEVIGMIGALKPDAVVNCAAYTNVDKCETDGFNAFKVNSMGAGNLSAAAFKYSAKILQVSTDYVFDGTCRIPRREYDPINPINCYGRSKALAETLVKETNPRHFIVRTAWLYGQGVNFARTMLNIAGQKDTVDVVGDQIGSPTSTVDLARCIISLLHTDGYGVYHATCEGECSWYEFAVKIFKISHITMKVNPITSEQLIRDAQRPKYSVLDNFMLKLCGLNNFRLWDESLLEYITEYCK